MSGAMSIYSSRAWRLSLLIVAVLVGTFLLYRPSSESLVMLWNDTGRITYTHGLVVALMACWLIIRRREQLAELPWEPSLLGAVLALPVGMAWFLAVRSGIEVVHQALLVPLLGLAVWAVFGWRIARALWVPVAFLLLVVPIWDLANPALQWATTNAVHLLLNLAGIPAYVQGNMVHLVAGTFEVEGGCSGLHFFLVSIALGTLYGELGRDTWRMRALLLGLAILFALLTNWLRVFIIVVAGHLTNMQHYLIREEHYSFGWMVFAVLMVVYLLIARRIAPPERAEAATSIRPATGSPRITTLFVSVACVAAVPAWEILQPVQAAALPAAGASLPAPPEGWSRAQAAVPWNPVFVGADLTERGDYVNASGARVSAFVAAYALQRQTKELVAYGNSLLGPDDGRIVGSARGELLVEDSRGVSVIRYRYRVGDRATNRGVVAQVWYALEAWRAPAVSSVLALRAACVPDCAAARSLLNEFDRTAARP